MSQLSIDTPGHVLREERKKQKKSLKEISRKLKINIKYLTAIEDEDYSLLPAELFTKSYLRMYADILGLDSNDILNLYESENKTEEIQEPPSRSSKEFYIKLKKYILPKISFRPLLLVVAVAFVVLSIALIIGDREQIPETKKTNKAQKTEIIEAKKEEKKIADKAVQKEKKKEKKLVVIKEEKKVEQKRDEMLLEIFATELTWVSISIDGRKAEERVLRTGQTATVSAISSFAVKVGNAGGTRMVLNGEDLGELGPHGKVVDIVLPANASL